MKPMGTLPSTCCVYTYEQSNPNTALWICGDWQKWWKFWKINIQMKKWERNTKIIVIQSSNSMPKKSGIYGNVLHCSQHVIFLALLRECTVISIAYKQLCRRRSYIIIIFPAFIHFLVLLGNCSWQNYTTSQWCHQLLVDFGSRVHV